MQKIITSFCSGVCVPHSLAACEDAAKAFGKKVGGMNHEFASPEYKTKGCYGYIKGREWEGGEEWQNKYVDYIFYGTGGSKEQIQYGLSPPEYRPPGFDCIYDGNVLLIFCGTISSYHKEKVFQFKHRKEI